MESCLHVLLTAYKHQGNDVFSLAGRYRKKFNSYPSWFCPSDINKVDSILKLQEAVMLKFILLKERFFK